MEEVKVDGYQWDDLQADIDTAARLLIHSWSTPTEFALCGMSEAELTVYVRDIIRDSDLHRKNAIARPDILALHTDAVAQLVTQRVRASRLGHLRSEVIVALGRDIETADFQPDEGWVNAELPIDVDCCVSTSTETLEAADGITFVTPNYIFWRI